MTRYHGTIDELNMGIPPRADDMRAERIDGIDWIEETEHSSRAKLNKYLDKVSGTIHIKKTTYGTWKTYRKV